MITTSDDRNFFTFEENLHALSEFRNLFNIQLKIVDVENSSSLLTLEHLSKALCDTKFNQNKEQYEEIKSKC